MAIKRRSVRRELLASQEELLRKVDATEKQCGGPFQAIILTDEADAKNTGQQMNARSGSHPPRASEPSCAKGPEPT